MQCWEDALELSPFHTDITRVSVPHEEAAGTFDKIVKNSPLPIVSDIHFRPPMALAALEAGTDKLRINPGNIRDPKLLKRIAQEAVRRKVPIRVGVNAGSLIRNSRPIRGAFRRGTGDQRHPVGSADGGGGRGGHCGLALKANDARWIIDAYKSLRHRMIILSIWG